MKIYEAISSRIMNLCYKRDITLYELSKISGIPKTTLKDIVSMKSQNTRIENVEKIAAAFNLSIRDFFDNDVFESM
jgi:transcriptional regulator, cro/CI family